MADMEGQSRSSAGVSQLENKIQELEELLRSEERYSATYFLLPKRSSFGNTSFSVYLYLN